MPKKRESQPIQVWLKNTDCMRLKKAAKFTARSQSEIVREALIKVLDELEVQERTEELEKQLFDGYSVAAKAVIACAEEAWKHGRDAFGTEDILLGLTADSTTKVGRILNHAGASWTFVRAKMVRVKPNWWEQMSDAPPRKRTKLDPSMEGLRALVRARVIAQRFLDTVIHPEHLILSLLEDFSPGAYEILQLAGIDYPDVREQVMKNWPKQVIRRTRRSRKKTE